MKIGIDGQLISGFKTGMGMVLYNVIMHWRSSGDAEIYLFVPKPLEEDNKLLVQNESLIVKVLGEYDYFRWEQFIIPREVGRNNIDILWCPYNTAPLFLRCKLVLTVHDMIFMNVSLLKTPSLYKKMGLLYRRLVVPLALRKADAITTVSYYSKEEILKYCPNKQIHVIYNAVDGIAEIEDIDISRKLNKMGIKKKYILGIGSLEYRKNTSRLIKAYEMLPDDVRKQYQLVLFGFRGFESSPERKYIREHFHNEEIVILEYVSDKDKSILYANSCVFVYPSLCEGFGIPILEAFNAMTPVITSNLTSMPEVAGNSALFIKPEKEADIRDAILKILVDGSLREQLVKRGSERAALFSWEKSAAEYMRVIMGLN